jgi:hypothetical protein
MYSSGTKKSRPWFVSLCRKHFNQSGARNFVVFKPKKQFVRVEARVSDRELWIPRLEEAGLPTLSWKGGGRLRFRLRAGEVVSRRDLLRQLFVACQEEHRG